MRVVHAEFDRVADVYDETLPPHINKYYAHKRVNFVRSFSSSGLVLDVGCGTGTLLLHLREAGYRVVGSEPSLEMLKQAAKRGITGSATCSVGQALPFSSGSFDLTVCMAVLHHIVDMESVAATIREMVRVTREGGFAVIWDHNPGNPYWSNLMSRVPQDAGEVRLVPAEEILAAIDRREVRAVRLFRRSWTPEFMPASLLPVWGRIEWALERLPLLKDYSAHNVVVIHK